MEEGELRNQIRIGQGTNSNLTGVAGRKRSRGEVVRADRGGETREFPPKKDTILRLQELPRTEHLTDGKKKY